VNNHDHTNSFKNKKLAKIRKKAQISTKKELKSNEILFDMMIT
jgi:hypothetical protein